MNKFNHYGFIVAHFIIFVYKSMTSLFGCNLSRRLILTFLIVIFAVPVNSAFAETYVHNSAKLRFSYPDSWSRVEKKDDVVIISVGDDALQIVVMPLIKPERKPQTKEELAILFDHATGNLYKLMRESDEVADMKFTVDKNVSSVNSMPAMMLPGIITKADNVTYRAMFLMLYTPAEAIYAIGATAHPEKGLAYSEDFLTFLNNIYAEEQTE